jgi:hypothetical protein
MIFLFCCSSSKTAADNLVINRSLNQKPKSIVAPVSAVDFVQKKLVTKSYFLSYISHKTDDKYGGVFLLTFLTTSQFYDF